jgi:transposase-like protein
VAQRLVNGESVSALHDELGIRRGVLYRWRDVYRKEGAAGLRLTGRPSGVEGSPREGNTLESARRIAELERKIGNPKHDAAGTLDVRDYIGVPSYTAGSPPAPNTRRIPRSGNNRSETAVTKPAQFSGPP